MTKKQPQVSNISGYTKRTVASSQHGWHLQQPSQTLHKIHQCTYTLQISLGDITVCAICCWGSCHLPPKQHRCIICPCSASWSQTGIMSTSPVYSICAVHADSNLISTSISQQPHYLRQPPKFCTTSCDTCHRMCYRCQPS